MTKLDKFLDMFKGPSGGYDLARVLFGTTGFFSGASGTAYQGYALAIGQAWHPLEFFGGIGILMTSFLAAAYGIKTKDKGVADALAIQAGTDGGNNAAS